MNIDSLLRALAGLPSTTAKKPLTKPKPARAGRFSFPAKPRLRRLGLLLLLALVALASAWLYLGRNPSPAAATWWNDSWSYRKAITITNNTATEHNVYASTTLDTFTASSSMQTDCGDFRFVNSEGRELAYYIVSGCRSANNIIHINFETFPAGEQIIYFYYGNPTVENGYSAADFSTEATN